MAVAVVGPIAGAGLVALVFAAGADSADTGRLQSYYVLKPLDAALLATAVLVSALAAVAVARSVDAGLLGSRLPRGLARSLTGIA